MKKNSCISCNLNSYTYIYALLLPISCMLIHFFQELMFQEYKHGNTEKTSFILLKYNLPLLFYYFLPKIFSIIFILILKIKSRGESDDVNGQNLVLRKYHISIRHEKTKQIILLIYLISLLEVIFKEGDFLLTYFNKTAQIGLLIEKRTGFIIFVPIFSFFILHKKLYKHHIFALILALIGSFILNFCRFPLNFAKKEDYPFHLIYIVFASFFSLSLVLIKFLFIKYLISPYNFLLYDGIFCIVNSLICGLLAYEIIININDKFLIEENKNYFKYNYLGIIYIFNGQNWLFFLSFFISFIASFLYFIFPLI